MPNAVTSISLDGNWMAQKNRSANGKGIHQHGQDQCPNPGKPVLRQAFTTLDAISPYARGYMLSPLRGSMGATNPQLAAVLPTVLPAVLAACIRDLGVCAATARFGQASA